MYLYVIGKLYTGVGYVLNDQNVFIHFVLFYFVLFSMETILEHQRKLMLQLSALLQTEPLAITRNRLMKMLALNIFIIEHNLEKGNYIIHLQIMIKYLSYKL